MWCPSAATAWGAGSRSDTPITWNDEEFSQVLYPALGWFPGVWKTTSILVWTERTQQEWNEMSLQKLSPVSVDCSSGLQQLTENLLLFSRVNLDQKETQGLVGS